MCRFIDNILCRNDLPLVLLALILTFGPAVAADQIVLNRTLDAELKKIDAMYEDIKNELHEEYQVLEKSKEERCRRIGAMRDKIEKNWREARASYREGMEEIDRRLASGRLSADDRELYRNMRGDLEKKLAQQQKIYDSTQKVLSERQTLEQDRVRARTAYMNHRAELLQKMKAKDTDTDGREIMERSIRDLDADWQKQEAGYREKIRSATPLSVKIAGDVETARTYAGPTSRMKAKAGDVDRQTAEDGKSVKTELSEGAREVWQTAKADTAKIG